MPFVLDLFCLAEEPFGRVLVEWSGMLRIFCEANSPYGALLAPSRRSHYMNAENPNTSTTRTQPITERYR